MDTAPQIATTSGKQGKAVSGSQPLGKLLAQSDRCQRPQTAQKITAVAGVRGCAPMSDCRPDSAPGARLEQRQGCGKGSGPGLGPPDPQKGTAPQAQDRLCQPGGTRGSRGKEQGFSRRRLVRGEGLISSRLPRALWDGRTPQPPGCRTPFPQSQIPQRQQLPGKAGPGWPLCEGNEPCPRSLGTRDSPSTRTHES